MGHAARDIAEETAIAAIDPGRPGSRAIAGRESPTILAIGFKLLRVAQSIVPLDLDRVFKAAAASGTALEINSGYPRLDLHDINARNAIAAGCTLTINTDTHTTIFEEINWGIGVARRAWVEPRHVLNCMKLAELKKFLSNKRDRA